MKHKIKMLLAAWLGLLSRQAFRHLWLLYTFFLYIFTIFLFFFFTNKVKWLNLLVLQQIQKNHLFNLLALFSHKTSYEKTEWLAWSGYKSTKSSQNSFTLCILSIKEEILLYFLPYKIKVLFSFCSYSTIYRYYFLYFLILTL